MKKILMLLVFIISIGSLYKIDKSDDIKDNNIDNKNIENHKIEEDKNEENIVIGSDLDIVEKILGKPNRIDNSEYDFKWHVYNEYEEGLVMIGVYDNEVVGIYTNANDEVKGFDKSDIESNYTSLEYKIKGNVKYVIEDNEEYDIFVENDNYITVFYDIHNDYEITSYQIIKKDIEDKTNNIYTSGDKELREDFENQMIDLINSTRKKHNLNELKKDERATNASRNHSNDMNINNYFDHINKNNQTPFDRLKEEGVSYIGAAENIAAGQTSSIYAHEALMNSSGHRKNILGDYKYIGSGVDFGGEYKIYYTQKFFK